MRRNRGCHAGRIICPSGNQKRFKRDSDGVKNSPLFEIARVFVALDHVALSILKNFFTAVVYLGVICASLP
jgi:hypothetical protein